MALVFPKDRTYVLPTTADSLGRKLPPHGFTKQTLVDKRFNEVTSVASVTLGFFLPFLNNFNARLEHHVNTGEELTQTELTAHVRDCLMEATVSMIDISARVAVQTTAAVVLLQSPTPAGDAIVYQWDAYARYHYKYAGDLLATLRLPRVLASLLGPKPTGQDIAVHDVQLPFACAFEDSLKRHALVHLSDIVVSCVRLLLSRALARNTSTAAQAQAEKRRPQVTAQLAALTVQKTIAFVGRAIGAAVGNKLDSGRGEYFGEYVGAAVFAMVGARLMAPLLAPKA